MKPKIKVPEGYRRVSNGYTRAGDLVWRAGEWVAPANSMELVSKYEAVARQKSEKMACQENLESERR